MLFKITWSFSYYYQSDTLFCGDDEDRNGYVHTHSDTAKLQKLSQNDALRRLNLSLDKNPNSTLDVGVLWHAFVCTMCNCTCREMPKRRKIQIHAYEWNIWMGYKKIYGKVWYNDKEMLNWKYEFGNSEYKIE